VSFGIAGLVGAVAAGVAVATVGPGYVVAFDAFSYLGFAVCLLGTRGPGRCPAGPGPGCEPGRRRARPGAKAGGPKTGAA
jgi:hypothetical protein